MVRCKKFITLGIMMILTIGIVSADEISAVWSRLYRNAVSLEHRRAIMERIVEQDNRDLIPVMDEALGELILMWENLPSTTDKAIHRDLVIITVRELGSIKAPQSAPRIFQVMEAADDAFLEATAVRALAEMGARDYADEIAGRLETLNLGITKYSSREEIETVAASCIYALERLREPVGYEPLFFASLAGYSSLVNDRIDRALTTIIDDPTDILRSILIEYSDIEIKIRALSAAAVSSAPPERIIDVALEALNQGLTINSDTRTKNLALSRLRIKAAEIIRDSGVDSTEASSLLRLMLTRMFEMNEILTCLEALGSQKNDVAAKALSDFLQYHNQRPSDIRSQDDYRIVTATIHAMGNTGNRMVIPALTEVEFRDWNRDVRRAAEEAISRIE